MRSFKSARVMAVLAGLAAATSLGSCGSAATTRIWSVSGTVAGAVSQGVTVTLGGASSATAKTDAAGHYAFAGLADGDYTVTPSLAGCTFTPDSRTVNVSGADVTGQDFTAALVPHGISGTVSGAVAQGVTVSLTGASSATTTTDEAGRYVFAGLPNGDYTVAPSFANLAFTPASRAVTLRNADETGLDFTAVAAPLVISGTVSGAVGQGVTVSLTGASSATTTTGAAGHYAFAGLASGDYTVTPSLAGHTFTPASRPVSVGGVNVGGRDFTAVQVCSIPVPSGDRTPPSAPTGLKVQGTIGTCAALATWFASTDDTGVAFYLVFQNGRLVGEVQGTKYFSDGNGRSQLLCFQVAASDCAGNVSPRSGTVCYQTPVGCGI
jgi:hypothetical protein